MFLILGHRFTVDGIVADPEKGRCHSGHASTNNSATVTTSHGNGPLPTFIPTRPIQRHASSESPSER